MTIAELKIGQSARVTDIGGEGTLRAHLLDMGLIPGVEVRLVKRAPLGDPLEIEVRGYALSLRLAEAQKIMISLLNNPTNIPKNNSMHGEWGYSFGSHGANDHPGLGEDGPTYHHHEDELKALPKGTKLTFALAGQQNCGKTTVFNVLTGSNQHVGNFPGVTVDRKDGSIIGHRDTIITDLPGIYSLSPYTEEEIVSREFILREHPHALINVVDANNIERNLYLTIQLMELGIPMVLALNMMDEVRGNGGSIRVNEMERILGIPVLPISAMKNEGIDELISHAIHVAKYQETPVKTDFCDADDHGGAVHRCLHGIKHLIEDHADRANIPAHFAATKLAEGDRHIMQALHLTDAEQEMVEAIIRQMEQERGMDRAAAIADMRFNFIERLCAQTVVRPHESREYRRSRQIDTVLTGRWTALPIFLVIMSMVIWLSIDVLGAPLQEALMVGIQRMGTQIDQAMLSVGVTNAVRSLVVDGIFGGVGAVVSFVPIIIILFFFLSILEDSGYMARVAFVTDKLLRHIGLSGRSIVPLLIGLGCSVPAVMASRTLPSSRDRHLTIMLTPFMSCSAKLPVYAYFSAAFFPGHGGLVLICLYLLGIIIGVLTALIASRLGNHSQAAPFVMELPNYRFPVMKNVRQLLFEKSKDYLQRAFTIIFLATIVIWLLQTFNFRFEMVANGEGSMLAWIAGLLSPFFKPIGLGDWRIVTALISGFMGKESVVATMGVLRVTDILNLASAVSMLVFCLLYTPCVATIAVVRRELGRKWSIGMIFGQCVIAWLIAFIAYQLALLL